MKEFLLNIALMTSPRVDLNGTNILNQKPAEPVFVIRPNKFQVFVARLVLGGLESNGIDSSRLAWHTGDDSADTRWKGYNRHVRNFCPQEVRAKINTILQNPAQQYRAARNDLSLQVANGMQLDSLGDKTCIYAERILDAKKRQDIQHKLVRVLCLENPIREDSVYAQRLRNRALARVAKRQAKRHTKHAAPAA